MSDPKLVPTYDRATNTIGWPHIFQYEVETGHDPLASKAGTAPTELVPYRPTYATHPAPDDFYRLRNNDTTPVAFQPASLPWKVKIHDLPAYEALMASGALDNPHHTGSRRLEVMDNRKTS